MCKLGLSANMGLSCNMEWSYGIVEIELMVSLFDVVFIFKFIKKLRFPPSIRYCTLNDLYWMPCCFGWVSKESHMCCVAH